MPIRNTTERWGGVSISIHWLTVLMVFALVVVGFVMQELPNSPTKIDVYAMHKSFGLTVLALTLLRLLWRLFAGTPAPVPGTPRWQSAVAQATHGALYVILLAMPLSGWLYNSASGFPLKWFGLFGLPKLSGYDPEVKAFALAMHEWLFIALLVIVVAHAAAALKHHYFDRDATLSRMSPGLKPPADAP
ncbi:cytochrome b [Arenimonas caeni]|uniref:Cytochrome b n=2 Tax=Arenimonas caeni TaxID=2058085 RepID=A0A2P6MD19_9GAMM|nr:cytochrome b [Arenimonas caeni]PRH83859.1 cytochrome b [Arenimonas caeni]